MFFEPALINTHGKLTTSRCSTSALWFFIDKRKRVLDHDLIKVVLILVLIHFLPQWSPEQKCLARLKAGSDNAVNEILDWSLSDSMRDEGGTRTFDVADRNIKDTGEMSKALVKIPVEHVEKAILLIRGEKVILDSDLAALYDVETRALLQAVKRNSERFPTDFMFQLTRKEFESLRSQSVISKARGGRRYLPHVFTEHGAIMAASVSE